MTTIRTTQRNTRVSLRSSQRLTPVIPSAYDLMIALLDAMDNSDKSEAHKHKSKRNHKHEHKINL